MLIKKLFSYAVTYSGADTDADSNATSDADLNHDSNDQVERSDSLEMLIGRAEVREDESLLR